MSAISSQNTGKNLETVILNGGTFFKIYNDTGAALANGDVMVVDYSIDLDSVGAHYIVREPLTGAWPRYICVVNNSPKGLATIEDATWGFVQISGFCPLVKTNGTVATEDTLEVLTAVRTAQRDTQASANKIVMSAGSFGKAVANVTTDQWTAILFGIPRAVAAT